MSCEPGSNLDWLNDRDRERIKAVFSSQSACFSDLVKAAGLNPATDFRFADLSCIDFSGSDLRGFDFSGANLEGTLWSGARWDQTTILSDFVSTDSPGSTERARELRDAALLRASEARLQLALDSDGAGMWEHAVETGEFFASERALMLHGLPPGIPVTRDILLAATHPEDRPKVERAWRATLETGVPFTVEFRCPQPDGSMRWLHSQGKLHEIGRQRRFICLVRDISGGKAAEIEVRTSRMRLQMALDAARLGCWSYDPVQTTASWDSRFKQIFGVTDPDADVPAVLARVLPEDNARLCEAAAEALNPLDPKPFVGEYRIQHGDGEIRWIEVYGMATFEGAGTTRRAVLMVGTAADITERKRAEEHQFLLMRELNHRSKNLLSMMLSMAEQTAASSPADFAERFTQRIQALAASHDLLVGSDWLGVEIEDLVRTQLAHFADLIGDRITIEGPPMSVTPVAAQSIGMALHELATNAGKYGSLSDDQGSVAIDWRIDGGEFSIGWIEHDGPQVKPPKRRGFGSTIISDVARTNIGGEVALDYTPLGVTWRLTCPVAKVLAPREDSKIRDRES